MDFLDEATITIRSGDGGRGCISFRREKFVPKGGPDGGDGGRGGSVTIRGNKGIQNLATFQSRKSFKAPNGQPGGPRGRSGKDGADLVIDVPLGTVVRDLDTDKSLADVIFHQQKALVLPGGKGGRGNQHFATSTRRTPRIAEPGRPGRERKLKLSLRFLADVGLVGMPNVGKSTLLSRLTMARPKIDDYPFTTTVPNLGVMNVNEDVAVTLADIPGLIEGAGEGRGLGHRFLKHIERTRLLVYLLDATYPCRDNPLEDFYLLRKEMGAFNPTLAQKPFIIAVNKIDLRRERGRDLEPLRQAVQKIGCPFAAVSALTGEGLDRLRQFLAAHAHGDSGAAR